MLCIGGPADGEVVEDAGPYMRMPQGYKPHSKRTVVYLKVLLQRRDNKIIEVYEAEGTDFMLELWEFYFKHKKNADAIPRR